MSLLRIYASYRFLRVNKTAVGRNNRYDSIPLFRATVQKALGILIFDNMTLFLVFTGVSSSIALNGTTAMSVIFAKGKNKEKTDTKKTHSLKNCCSTEKRLTRQRRFSECV